MTDMTDAQEIAADLRQKAAEHIESGEYLEAAALDSLAEQIEPMSDARFFDWLF